MKLLPFSVQSKRSSYPGYTVIATDIVSAVAMVLKYENENTDPNEDNAAIHVTKAEELKTQLLTLFGDSIQAGVHDAEED